MVAPNSERRKQTRENNNRAKQGARLVSFSKRKKGLLNKCMELSLLCDAQLACIIFSPTGKITLFGNSDVDVILDHFLNKTVPSRATITNQHQVQEYNRVKGKLKLAQQNAKCQENVALQYGQWIDEQLNSATTVEELDEIIKSIELNKQKLETRIKNFPSSCMNCNSNMVPEKYKIPPTIMAPPSNILPTVHSSQDSQTYFMPNLETNDIVQSTIDPMINMHKDSMYNCGMMSISPDQYVINSIDSNQEFAAGQDFESGDFTIEEILSIIQS